MALKQRSEGEQDAFLNLAHDRYQLAAQAESKLRKEALDDLRFSVGEQWPLDIKADRQINGRPCLTINVLPQYIKQITNEQREQRPSITVNPVGSNTDVDTAEILQGISRHIEVNSDAEVSYDYGFDYSVRMGFGRWRLDTEENEEKEQEIVVRLVRNPFCVYDDPNAQKLDRSDARWQFSMVDIPVSEFSDKYPQSKLATGAASFSDYSSTGDQIPGWASSAGPLPTIRVAEYWYFEGKKKEMNWALITALDILDEEETIWESPPNVGVFGEDLIVDGEIHQAGMVRHAKSAQEAKNYWTSAITEAVALAPKAPWVATPEQVAPYEAMYKQSNFRNLAVLYYKPQAVGGSMVPPPQRQAVEPAIQAMSTLLSLSSNDLQATTGLYPANLGQQQSSQESGKAVLARQKKGEVTNLNYSDNLARAIRRTGRMILNAIPKVYTSPRIQRIIQPDGTAKHVGIYNSKNDTEEKAMEAIAKQNPAIQKIYDVGTGAYDVAVSVGPSYQTKRQEAVETQMALIQAEPQLLNVIGDILVGNMDIPGSREISDRLKKILPPQLQDSDDPDSQTQQIISQHAQLTQQVQVLSQMLQKAQMEIQTKQVEQQGKLQIAQMQAQSDQVIQKAKIDAQIAVAEINTKAQNALERARMYNEIWTELHGTAHETAMSRMEHGQDMELAQQAAQQAQQQQQSDQTHDVGMAQLESQNQLAQQAAEPQNGAGGQ